VAERSVESAREAAVRALAERAISGGLTLDEYTERAAAVERATTVDELDDVLRRLPDATAATPSARTAPWIVSVFGGSEQRGRWRLNSRLRVVAVFSGVTLDLGSAEPEAPESLITVVTLFGGAGILAPRGVSLQLSGVSVLGGKGDTRTPGPPLPGSPLIRIRAFPIFGGVTVKERRTRRSLLDVIRGRSSQPARTA
jgi:hypothetical protein